jgi:hypothetical protein
MSEKLKIAVDFDGTIVEHEFPNIGKEMPGAFDTLIKLIEHGHQLILWTFRDGEQLEDAINFCLERGVMFWTINSSFPNEEYSPYISRKIHADIFIDDKNFGGFPGWDVIRRELLDDLPKPKSQTKKSRFFFMNKSKKASI